MKLHDLRPADGSRTERTRVGRGIAAGKGKTAGRGTKGQKARAGGSIPPWFEGGQTPLHVRIPKLRGFKNRFKLHYEVVNVGDIAAAAERGAFEVESGTGAKARGKAKAGGTQITVNQDILRAVGLVRTLDKPLKILGAGELGSPLFVVADAFTASARAKIEAAGGTVNVLEVPTRSTAALGVEPAGAGAAPQASKARSSKTAEAPAGDAADTEADDTDAAGDSDTADDAASDETAGDARAADAEPGEDTQPGDDAESSSGDDA
jgi:large subunit ribosomal protein L15